MSTRDLMKERHSVRQFKDEPISEEHREKLGEIVAKCNDDGISGTLLNERDELQRMLDDVRDGKSSSDGDDAMHSSDANTSHTTSSCDSTTNSDNIPNTKGCSMHTMPDSRTNRRSQVCTRKPAQ